MNKDRKIGLTLFLLGIILAGYTALTVPVTLQSELDPGSQIFPLLASIGLALCGLGVFFTAGEKDDPPYFSKEAWIRFGKLVVLFVLYMAGLRYLGFLLATPIFLYILVTWFAYEKKVALWKKIVFAIFMTAFVYIVFVRLLRVFLPEGMLF